MQIKMMLPLDFPSICVVNDLVDNDERKSLRNYIRFDQIILKFKNYTTFAAYYYLLSMESLLCFKMVALHVDLADATKQIKYFFEQTITTRQFSKDAFEFESKIQNILP